MIASTKTLIILWSTFRALSCINSNTWHLICNNFNLNFIFGIVCLYVCVCAFSLRRESPDMILGDEPLISDQSLYKTDSNYIALIKACIKKIDQSFITTNILHLQVTLIKAYKIHWPKFTKCNALSYTTRLQHTKVHNIHVHWPKLHHTIRFNLTITK
jgi:hypothetical protein